MIVLAIETLINFLNTNSRLSNFVSHFFTNKMNLVYKISMYVTFNTRRHLIMYIKTFVIKDLITWNKVILLGSRLNVNVHNPWIWHRSGIKRWHIHIRTILLNSSQIFHSMLTFVVTEWSTLSIKVWWHIPYALVASTFMSCFLHEHVYTKRHIDCLSFTFPWHIKANIRLIYK